jgi:hypothetical protein
MLAPKAIQHLRAKLQTEGEEKKKKPLSKMSDKEKEAFQQHETLMNVRAWLVVADCCVAPCCLLRTCP